MELVKAIQVLNTKYAAHAYETHSSAAFGSRVV